MKFEIKGAPRGQGRPRATVLSGRPHLYKDRKSREYEKQIADAYKKAGGLLHAGPVRLHILAAFPIPKSTTKRVKEAMLQDKTVPAKKPDLDNIIKAVMDGLNGAAYEDDAQVVALTAQKFFGEIPGITVTVQPDIRGGG